MSQSEFVVPKYWYDARLVRVKDGDTIVVDLDLGLDVWQHNEIIRLNGMNAPEEETEEGQDATRHLIGLLPPRLAIHTIKYVRLPKEKKGKYGRLLADVYTLDGENINLRMVHDGFAVEKHY